MRLAPSIVLLASLAATARGQSSISACGPLPDSTSRQQIKSFGELRVCMVATKVVGTDAETPAEWAAKGALVVLESQRPGDNRRAAITGTGVQWTINGQPAPQDSLADRWQQAVIELLDASYEADSLRAAFTALRADADSLPARRAATAQRIKDIERTQMELDRELVAARNYETTNRNAISRLEAQRDDNQRRAAAADRMALSTTDARSKASYEASSRQYLAEAQRLSEEIRRLEMSSRDSDPSRKVAQLQDEIARLNANGNLALLRMKLANYDSTKAEDLQQQITQLDAPRRLPALDDRVEKARLHLLAILEARGKAPSR